MYARINLIKIKDDKKEQAMSMMTEEIIPSYEGTEGLLSMGAVMCDDTTGLNMSIWTDKASSDATESNLQSNIEKGAEILDGAPEIYRGDLALGAIYEDRPAGSGEGDYARVVFAKVESEEAVTIFLKEKISKLTLTSILLAFGGIILMLGGSLTAGQARPLIGLSNSTNIAEEIVAKNLSARSVEMLVRGKKAPSKVGQFRMDSNICLLYTSPSPRD